MAGFATYDKGGGVPGTTVYADNVDFTGTGRTNTITTNGQLLIGATVANAGGNHINVGTITSPDSSVTISYSSPNITVAVAGGTTVGKTITGDTGGALSPTAGNWNIIGQDGITTHGATSTLTITPRGTGTGNMFLGQGAGNLTLSGSNNVGYGSSSLPALTSGQQNTCVGINSGLAIQDGQYNVAVGATSLPLCVSGQYNVAVGTNALHNYTGSNCVAIGATALGSLVSAADNTAVGYLAATNVTGTNNVAIGSQALANSTGNNNTVVGVTACAGIGASSDNTLMGFQSGIGVTSGSQNSGFGYGTLNHLTTGTFNTCLGYDSLFNVVSGSYNIGIGYNAGSQYTTSDSSNICIANAGTTGDNNKIRIGTQGSGAGQQNECYIAGITGVTVANAAPVVLNTSTGQLGQGTAAGIFAWTDVTGASQTIAVNNGYLSDRAGTVAFALPATATQFSIFRIVGVQGAWTLSQAANQQIKIGSAATTVGVTGSLASTNAGDCIECICTTGGASTVWRVMSMVGNITVA